MSSYPVSGDRLAHFRIVRKLGEGGMGAVFEAEDERLGRRVALKLLPAEFVGAREHRARFLREARAAAAVEHRSIATVHEIGEDGDRVFIAMELVRGQSLRERLAGGPLPLSEALSITIEVTKGLAKAHAVGVVHRDLKPDNVMLSADGEVKILDFGIAKSVDAGEVIPDGATAMPTTEAGRVLGTPGYMSPEQAQGRPVDARTDLFSVGALLFELCTGERVFVGDTPLALLIATVQHEPPPLTARRPGTPSSVEHLVHRCLEKDPDERIGSAEVLLAELERALESLRDTESAQTVVTPLSAAASDIEVETPRRRALLGVAAVLMLGAAAGFGTWRYMDSESTSTQPVLSASHSMMSAASAPSEVIACPLIEESAPGLPPGWMGAAAASLVCSDLSLAMGVASTRTRIPAELLDLPKQVVDDFAKNPFGEPDARQRSLEAARAVGWWVDGRVDIVDGAFQLRLRLRTLDGPMGEPVQATESTLHAAVFSIVDRWIDDGQVVVQSPSPVEVRVRGCTELACLRQVAFTEQILATAPDGDVACMALMRSGGHARWTSSRRCGAESSPPPALGQSDPVFLALDGLNHAVERSAAENIARAAELATARSVDMPQPMSHFLRLSEAELRAVSGEPSAARTLADQATLADPRSCAARRIAAFTSTERSSRPGIIAAFGAWCPWRADAYAGRNWNDADQLEFARLTVQLSSPSPTYAPWLAYELLRREQREEARGLASQLLAGFETRRHAGTYIMALVEADEGRLTHATERLRRAILGREQYPSDSTTELSLLSALLIAEVTGTDEDLADDFVQRFLLTEPAKVERGTRYLMVAHAVMRARKPIALAGLKRVRELLDSGVLFGKGMGDDAYLGGVERFVEGDAKGAVRYWRPLAAVPAFQFSLRPEVFDRAGEHELASSIDQFRVDRAWRMGLAHVREAHRAVERGETDRARHLAQRVIDKWATADAEIAYVKEMRALVAQLERP